MTTAPWAPGSATGVGSLPGQDPREAAAVVLGELPDLPHLPELPGRGTGSDTIGRTAALLVDLAVELVPSGYRVTAHRGIDHRRAEDHLRRDLDAIEEAAETTGPKLLKLQLAGPWTLATGVELPRGHRVLTDRGALREFGESLAEGLTRHVAEVRRRTGAEVVVQLDEPSLPAVLAGSLPTPSGYGMVPPVPAPDARDTLATLVDAAKSATGHPVVVHCCAPRPPVALLRSAGAEALSLDATLLATIPATLSDDIGEAWDAGTTFFLGLVPSTDPTSPVTLRGLADPALKLVDRLGFPRTLLAGSAVVTPTCGLAGATHAWARRALSLSRDLGKAFVEPPESW
ncbi:putative Methionine synthase, vitamin-B12 independent [Actinokineospora spheciospongiae]|uniref:Putative Methionine synthase, vitamin-B12 independent n=1 Tax=Actinokineospora spheciospongiae TaxID=909613 RepID=W7IVL3_9PSEU|nr:methionine synthase [Actinokineospora spheciospongiae]EWC64408.1 putative Methionine synthase, vitamin-B12 independent [Actinokineospora spheciospongiae]PWW55417.1 cobalamin-independent methionine synthase catalytic subunit [Actinokineospora spheciospongiae]